MSLDPRIKSAVQEAVQELGQPSTVADRLVAWLESIADGNEQLSDRDSVHRRLELLYDSVVVNLPEESAQEE